MDTVNRATTPLKLWQSMLSFSAEQQQMLLRKTQDSLKKQRLAEVRKQEKELAKRSVEKYKAELEKKENIETNTAMYEHYIETKQEIERLKLERELALEMQCKAQRDAVIREDQAKKAAEQKKQLLAQQKLEAQRRGVEALKKQKMEEMMRTADRDQLVEKKKQVIEQEKLHAKEVVAQYQKEAAEREKDAFVFDEGRLSGLRHMTTVPRKKEDYINTRYHNTLILRNESALGEKTPSAMEKARNETLKAEERLRATRTKQLEAENKAKARHDVAMGRLRDEHELEEMEKELKRIKEADAKAQIEAGRKPDAFTIQMPHTVEQSRKWVQKEAEKYFEHEFLDDEPIELPAPAKPVQPVRAQTQESQFQQPSFQAPTVAIRVCDRRQSPPHVEPAAAPERQPEPEPAPASEQEKVLIQIPQPALSSPQKDASLNVTASPARPEPMPQPEQYFAPPVPAEPQRSAQIMQSTSTENAQDDAPARNEPVASVLREPEPMVEFGSKKTFSVLDQRGIPEAKEEDEADSSAAGSQRRETAMPAPVAAIPEETKATAANMRSQPKGSTLLNEFLNSPPRIADSPKPKSRPQSDDDSSSISKSSESLISSVISSQKSPMVLSKPTESKQALGQTPGKSELNYSATESEDASSPPRADPAPQSAIRIEERPVPAGYNLGSTQPAEQKAKGGVLCGDVEEEDKSKSLADVFLSRKLKKQEPPRREHKERTKEEILEIRRKMMKSTVKRDESSAASMASQSSNPRSVLMDRLASGAKPEIKKEDMLRLTNKNYEQLPEVRRKKEEERKKQELKERIKNAKELEKVCVPDCDCAIIETEGADV